MTETECEWCPRFISKHNPLALQVCLLKAIREKRAGNPDLSETGMKEIPDIEETDGSTED